MAMTQTSETDAHASRTTTDIAFPMSTPPGLASLSTIPQSTDAVSESAAGVEGLNHPLQEDSASSPATVPQSRCLRFRHGVLQHELGLIAGVDHVAMGQYLASVLKVPPDRPILGVADSYGPLLSLPMVASSPLLLREPFYDLYLGA